MQDQGDNPLAIPDSLQAKLEKSMDEDVPKVMITEEDNERGIDQKIRVGQDKIFI